MRDHDAAACVIDPPPCMAGDMLAALLKARQARAQWLPFYLHLEKCEVCFQELKEVRRDRHFFRKTWPVDEDAWVEEDPPSAELD